MSHLSGPWWQIGLLNLTTNGCARGFHFTGGGSAALTIDTIGMGRDVFDLVDVVSPNDRIIHDSPKTGILLGRGLDHRGTGPDVLATHLNLDIGVGAKVVQPRRVLIETAIRGNHDDALAVASERECIGTDLAATATDGVQYQRP